MTDLFADVNGIKICYEILGEGEPLLLVHGFGSKKENWIAQFKPLSEHFKVIRFDNRGAGKSDRHKGVYTMELFADDIAGLLNHLEINKTHIIGWSLGGMIVQNFILKYPARVNKIVLINTNHGLPNEQGADFYKNSRIEEVKKRNVDPIKTWWDSARSGFYMKFRKQIEAEPSKKWFGLWSAEELIKESIVDPTTIDDIEYQADALKSHNTYDRLSQIKNQTLLITASHDRLTPQSSMEEIHSKIPNSTIKVMEKAGHSSPLSRAPEVNKLITNFLKN